MSATPSSDSKLQPESKASTRHRSPAYPAFSLKDAVEKAKALYAAQRKHEAHLDSAIKSLGYASQTGPALRSIAALDQFGLLENTGSKNDRRVKLTELARDIVELPPSDSRHQKALKTAALAPKIYAHLWERYQHLLPDDTVVLSHLVRDKEFNDVGAASVVEDYRATIEFAKLDKVDSGEGGGNVERSPEGRQPDAARKDDLKFTLRGVAPPPVREERKDDPMTQELPVLVGDGKIARIPFPMTEDDFDLLIGTLNLWKKRIVKAALPKFDVDLRTVDTSDGDVSDPE